MSKEFLETFQAVLQKSFDCVSEPKPREASKQNSLDEILDNSSVLKIAFRNGILAHGFFKIDKNLKTLSVVFDESK